MREGRPSRLQETEPLVGVTLLFEGREWAVTGRSTYWNPEDLWVTEWGCEAGETTAYLLKEVDEQKNIRWFFTREISEDAVQLPDGEALEPWMQRQPDLKPPPVLLYGKTTCRHEDTAEGTHEEESGERSQKVTWEYWDDRHAHNLAVELWPDGAFECYHGAYILPQHVTIRYPAASAASTGRPGFSGRLAANPFLAALLFLPIAYLLAFMAGRPLDSAMAFALPAAAVGGWFFALGRAPAAGGAALLLGLLAAAVFWRFPPLTSGPGVVALFGTPAAIAWVARERTAADRRPAVRYAAAWGVGTPLLIVGLVHYFRFAPMPHTPAQYALALAPAALGVLAALVVSGLVFRGAGGDAP